MSKTKFLTLGLMLLLALNAVTLFLLFRMRSDGVNYPRPPEGPANYIVKQLQLDEKQQQQFAGLRRQHQEMMRRIHDEQKRLHDGYFDLLKTDDPDESRVDSIATLMSQNEKNIELATFDHFKRLRTICRNDQKKLFDDTIDEIARMLTKPGPPGGGPPRP
jgi:periplasmic protein CpxP/Spy